MPADNSTRWAAYFWPGTNVLRNRYNIRDEQELRRREYRETSKREAEIRLGRIAIPKTGNAEELQALHAHLFGNIYEWAGTFRDVNMTKIRGFCGVDQLDRYMKWVSDRIKPIEWQNLNQHHFVNHAAYSFMILNWAHPFREGNGRVTKLFMDRQIEAAPYELDYSKVTPLEWDTAFHFTRPEPARPPDDYRWLLPTFNKITVRRAEAAPATPSSNGPTLTATLDRRGPTEGATITEIIAAAGLDNELRQPLDTTPPQTGAGPDENSRQTSPELGPHA